MLQTLIFSAQHYAMLALFLWAAWGVGDPLWTRLGAEAPNDSLARDPWLGLAMAGATGLGIFIVVLQGLGIAGMLHPGIVMALLLAATFCAAWRSPQACRRLRAWPAGAPWSAAEKAVAWVAFGAALVSLVEPLAPPFAFDEMMYHLPWARETAHSGHIAIHDWLRYPWFPYNYNLLYAAALPWTGDVFTHLQHALAGWLSAAIVFRLAMRYTDRIVAGMTVVILLAVGEYANALIDMGVGLFVLAGCVALWIWEEDAAGPTNRMRPARWLVLAGFFLGLAAGSKYQALTFLPLLGLFVLWRERRPGPWLLAFAAFLVPCVYWYARNWLQTGDPFNPIGARVFGFTNWNATDYRQQLDDVRAHASWPNVLFWPLLLVPLSLFWKGRPAVRAAFAFGAWSLIVWVLTSRYPRYMMASFPLLAWLGAIGWRQLFFWARAFVHRRVPTLARRPWPQAGGGALVLVLALAGAMRFAEHARMISPTPAAREAFLARHVPGYAVLGRLRADPPVGKLYQVGLSDAIYYAPNPVWGDVFGPYRYAGYLLLPAPAMAQKLAAHGFGTIVIRTSLGPYVDGKPDFERYFRLVAEQDGVKAYRILPDSR